jgi:DNA polymerase-3 subunit delta'
MAHNWKIAGHKKPLQLLSKSIDSGSLPHALIFSGPERVGKRTVARNLARILLCQTSESCENCLQCRSFASLSNPDYIELSVGEAIKIEHIRRLAYQLNLKPYSAKYKVAIIDNAEDMTLEAQNALLKLLEEPKLYTVIVLVTSNAYRLLPTIASRAQKINFGPVSPEDYDYLLSAKTDNKKTTLLSMSYGKPGLALSILENSEQLKKIEELNNQYRQYMGSDLAERMVLAQTMSDMETPDLKAALHLWLVKLEAELKNNPSVQLAKKLSSVVSARKLIDGNVNAKLLLTNMMINS